VLISWLVGIPTASSTSEIVAILIAYLLALWVV
jgi:hypothetical protein